MPSRRETLVAALSLFGIAVLAYGLLIPWLGFYWNDWDRPVMYVPVWLFATEGGTSDSRWWR